MTKDDPDRFCETRNFITERCSKYVDFLSVYKEWSQIYFYIFIYMFNSTELMMSIDRGMYELRTNNNTITAALLFVFK